MRYGFNREPEFYFGIEEEFQLYDKDSLKPVKARKIIEPAGNPNIKPELLENMIETNTRPCSDIAEAVEQLAYNRQVVSQLCDEVNAYSVACGIYPFLHHEDVAMNVEHAQKNAPLFLDDRIAERKDYIFSGIHIHISMGSFEHALRCMDCFTAISGLLVAIGSNSTHIFGTDTGYTGFRKILWTSMGKDMLGIKKEKMDRQFFQKYPINTSNPPTGLSPKQYEEIIDNFLVLGSWMNWVDYREERGTLQLRHFDQVVDLDDVVAIASLTRSLAWTFVNKNFHSKDFYINPEHAAKVGLKCVSTLRKAEELLEIVRKCPLFSESDEMKLRGMLEKRIKLTNYVNINDPFRFTADNSINSK